MKFTLTRGLSCLLEHALNKSNPSVPGHTGSSLLSAHMQSVKSMSSVLPSAASAAGGKHLLAPAPSPPLRSVLTAAIEPSRLQQDLLLASSVVVPAPVQTSTNNRVSLPLASTGARLSLFCFLLAMIMDSKSESIKRLGKFCFAQSQQNVRVWLEQARISLLTS